MQLHKLSISCVYEHCATDGRIRDARLAQGFRIRAVLVAESLPFLQLNISPSAHLETVCERGTTTNCSFSPWSFHKEVCPDNEHDFIHQQTHLFKLSYFVFRVAGQGSTIDMTDKTI